MASIGKYEVREKIGAGGFGIVYRAYDPFIRREVAIKTCSSEEEDVRRRFANEARIAGNLQHRNITTVYDFGLHEETPYLVQEYLSGEDLDRKIRRKEYLSFPEKLLYLVQIARGLAFAHDNGVIHRDIKPGNIRILEDGTAKIMDFGIAKLAQQETSLTKTGLTVGTAAYLAPEQVTGMPIDPRTDIFSYGVLAYELLTYERPFPGPRISNVLLQIAQQPHTPLRDFWPDCPQPAIDIVDRCLQKKPADRYPDCHALLQDLDRILESTRNRPEAPLSHRTQVVEVEPRTTRLDVSREQSRPEGKAPWSPPSKEGEQESQTKVREEAPPPPGVRPTPAITAPVTTQPPVTHGAPALAPQTRAADPGGDHTTGEPAIALEDLDLGIGSSRSRYRKTASRPTATRHGSPRRSTSSSPLPWIFLGMVVVLGALAIGWQLGNRGIGPLAPTTEEAVPGREEVSPPAAAAPEGVGEAAKPTPPASVPKTALPERETPPPIEEPAAKPPPPPPGILVVAKAWDPRMTFEVAGRSQAMDRDRRVELEAGRYDVIFRFDSGEYRSRRAISVELASGQEKVVSSPIRPPGRIRLQAALGSPQGRLDVDGKSWGSSPQERPLAAGAHEVSIHGGPQGTSTFSLDVPAGRKVTVTFDLREGGTPKIITQDG